MTYNNTMCRYRIRERDGCLHSMQSVTACNRIKILDYCDISETLQLMSENSNTFRQVPAGDSYRVTGELSRGNKFLYDPFTTGPLAVLEIIKKNILQGG